MILLLFIHLPSKTAFIKMEALTWVPGRRPGDFHAKAEATESAQWWRIWVKCILLCKNMALYHQTVPSWCAGNMTTVCSLIKEVKW